ncbi:restriction endonuclease subunit S [Mycolicibacterium iranicum]|uniref:Restriction endonuclease subunit S n=1 Tax=Mycolicibacterium iranicum TaxID=912594 RepID=A0ABT4HPK9_MYCIR|nr:restriction endonuclease subunit S [Mycolicibacterium iranicum]MCZ0732019.1 restriction endonuclease subunit S [Mycolicibacterium iranicum]
MKHACLGEVATLVSGGTPPRGVTEYFGAGVPWASIGDLNDSLVTETKEALTASGFANSAAKIVPPGTVLVAMYGASIGKLGVAGSEMCTNQAIAAIQPSCEDLDSRYLYHFLLAQRKHLRARGRGGAQPNISLGDLKKWVIPLRPMNEQRRIGAMLDQAENLRTKRSKVIKHLIALEKATFIDTFGDPIGNEMGWPTGSLGQQVVRITDGEHKTPLRTEAGIPLLSARSVQRGWIDFTATDFVGEDVYERLRRRIEPQDGDVLISCSGTIGRVARVRGPQRFAMVRSVALVRPGASLSPGFLEQLLATDSLNALMNVRANSSAQANLFQNQIRDLPVIVPPIGLQKSFEEQIESVTRQRAISTAALSKLVELFASLQFRAFSGQL